MTTEYAVTCKAFCIFYQIHTKKSHLFESLGCENIELKDALNANTGRELITCKTELWPTKLKCIVFSLVLLLLLFLFTGRNCIEVFQWKKKWRKPKVCSLFALNRWSSIFAWRFFLWRWWNFKRILDSIAIKGKLVPANDWSLKFCLLVNEIACACHNSWMGRLSAQIKCDVIWDEEWEMRTCMCVCFYDSTLFDPYAKSLAFCILFTLWFWWQQHSILVGKSQVDVDMNQTKSTDTNEIWYSYCVYGRLWN